MRGTERWRDNWVAVSPPGALRVDLRRSGAQGNALTQRIRHLPSGSAVALFASAPGAIRRCRRFAAAADVELEGEYLAFPSATTPAYLVEDDPAPVRLFVETVLVAPPRAAFAKPFAAALWLLRAFGPWRLIRALAPGRVVVGRRR